MCVAIFFYSSSYQRETENIYRKRILEIEKESKTTLRFVDFCDDTKVMIYFFLIKALPIVCRNRKIDK